VDGKCDNCTRFQNREIGHRRYLATARTIQVGKKVPRPYEDEIDVDPRGEANNLALTQKAVFGEWLAKVVHPRREVGICVCFNVLFNVRFCGKVLGVTADIDGVL